MSVVTEGMTHLQRLWVVLFVQSAMWFIGWFVPHLSDKAAEDGIASAEDAAKTRVIARCSAGFPPKCGGIDYEE